MPEIMHSMKLEYPVTKLWKLVNSPDQLVTIIPGYVNHEIVSDRKFAVSFKVKYGMIKKLVKMHIDIHKCAEPHLMTFSFKSDSKHIIGNGKYMARPLNPKNTKLTITLDVYAQGAMGPMINSFLRNYEPQQEWESQITNALANKISEVV